MYIFAAQCTDYNSFNVKPFYFYLIVMATSKTFFGLRRGSTKSMTFQVLNGQQITKDRVYGGRNPRSDAQMTQRSQFLSAVRFYERSLRRFFKFAFESKKQTESEYNAFMRLNAKLGPYITKAQGDAVGFPMVAPWCISQGSLLTLPQAIIQDPDLGSEISLLIAKNWDGDGPYTIAQLSQLIRAAHPSVLEGDIITIMVIRGTEAGTAFVTDYDAANITNENEWIIDQFIINSSDEREIGEVLAQANVSVVDGSLYLVGMVGDTDMVYAGAIVVSRKTADGLVVSTNTLKLNALATTAYETMRDNAHREQVLAWWGAQQQAILQGSLASPASPAPSVIPAISAVSGFVEGGYSSIPTVLQMYLGDTCTYVLMFDGPAEGVVQGSMLNVTKTSGDIINVEEYATLKWVNDATLQVQLAIPSDASDWIYFNLNEVQIGEFERV